MSTDAFHPEYLQRLPLPLAQLYRRAYNAKDPRGRHDAAFYLFEAGIKLGAAAHVQAYDREIQAGEPRVSNLEELLKHLSLPSLGHWLGILRELAKHFNRRADHATHPLGHVWQQLSARRRDLPGVLALFRRIKNGADGEPAGDQSCTLLELFEAMVQYRNGVFGHGGLRFDSFFAEEMGPLMFPAINEVLGDGVLNLTGPRGSRLIYMGDSRPASDGRLEISVRELSGTDGWTAPPLIMEADVLSPRCVAVAWPGHRSPLRLDPLLTYREGELADEVLFLNRDRNGRAVEYLSYTSGRTLRDAATAPLLSEILVRLAGSLAAVGAAREPDDARLAAGERSMGGQEGRGGRPLEDFEILAELGRGAVGIVYLARQRSLGRLVALKMLARELSGDETALMRFRREMRALSQCDHPNVVKVLSSGSMADGQMYYAMEYVPGCDLEHAWQELYGGHHDIATATLGATTWKGAILEASRKEQQRILAHRQRLDIPNDRTESSALDETHTTSEKPDSRDDSADENCTQASATSDDGAENLSQISLPTLPTLPTIDEDPGGYQRRVATIIREAALALQAVHEQNIVHRDIKPANIMLTADGSRVVLMDFGLAKGGGISLSATRAAGFLGTLRYAAPEQLASGRIEVGPPADIRALGVVFWELLTRRRLFNNAQDEAQLSQMVFARDVPRLRAIDSTLDPDLEAIIARATERNVSDRIDSARRFAEYIDLYLEGKPLPIRTPSPAEMVRRWARENRRQFLFALAGLAIVVATTVAAFIAITSAWRSALQAEANERTQRLATEQSLYVAQMNLAQRAWDRRDTAAVLDILRGHLPSHALSPDRQDLRDFGWHYLWRVCHEEPRLLGHGGPVKSVAFSPAGKLLASVSFDHTLRLWDEASGRPLATLGGHQAPLFAVALSHDGKWLATAGGDRVIKVLSAIDRKPAFELPQRDVITCLAFSPDGKWLASGGDDNQIWIWNLENRSVKKQLSGHREHVHGLAFSPDGSLLASGSGDGTVRLWDASRWELIAELDGHVADIFPVAFSPDGTLLAAGTTEKTAIVWRVSDRQLIASLGTHLDRVEAVGFSPDGKTLASADGGGLLIFWQQDAAGKTWQKSNQVRAHLGPIYSLAYSTDGQRLATGSGDGSIRLLVANPQGAASARDAAQPDLLAGFDGPVNCVAFAPHSSLLAAGSGDGTVLLNDCQRGTLLQKLVGDPRAGAVYSVSFSNDGRSLAVGRGRWDESGCVEVWRQDAARGMWRKSQLNIPCANTVSSVAFSSQGDMLAIGGFDRQARIFRIGSDQSTLVQTFAGHTHWINALAISPDGTTLATASQDYTVRIWDASTGECRLVRPHNGMVRSIAISPGAGQWLATGDWDWTVHLLDMKEGGTERILKGHRGAVHGVCFAPDGKTLASGSYDGTVKLWNVGLGQEVLTLGETSLTHDDARVIGTDRRRIAAVAFSDDGRLLAAASGENHVKLWWHTGRDDSEPAP